MMDVYDRANINAFANGLVNTLGCAEVEGACERLGLKQKQQTLLDAAYELLKATADNTVASRALNG